MTFGYDATGALAVKTVATPTTVTTTHYIGGYYERTVGGAPRRYYRLGDQLVLYDGAAYHYLYSDQLNSAVLTTNAGGAKTSETRYYPYGAHRYDWGSDPSDRDFTGQRRDVEVALLDYVARHYSPYLGRFVSPDSIVPQAGNPQALNRYAYTLNNPLRFTDPTGFFSEDEIMKYYKVKTWDEVLAMFGKDGKLEGRWGWLETLRQAQLGDEVWFNANASLTSPNAEKGIHFQGVFAEDQEGHLRVRTLLEDGSRDSRLLDPDTVVTAQSAQSYALFRNDPTSQLAPRSWVGEWQANQQYVHLRSVNWNRLLDPVAGEHLVAAAGITLFTGGLTVAQFAGAAALCVEPMTCAGGVLMGFNGLASLTATYFLGQGTSALVEHHWRESTVYGP